MPSLDTNILLRIILRDNSAQLKAAKLLLARHDVFAVADLAVVELEYILTGYYGYSRQQFNDIVTKLLISNQHITANRQLFERALKLYLKHPTESFDDCCLAVYAKLNKHTPLYTFDKKMARDLPWVELVA